MLAKPQQAHLQWLCSENGTAIKLRLMEQACGCSTEKVRLLVIAAGTRQRVLVNTDEAPAMCSATEPPSRSD